MKKGKGNKFIIEVPKFVAPGRSIDLGSVYTLSVVNSLEKRSNPCVSGKSLKNQSSLLFRALATSVAVLMFLSPLSPFIESVHADEGDMEADRTDREKTSKEAEDFEEEIKEESDKVEEEKDENNTSTLESEGENKAEDEDGSEDENVFDNEKSEKEVVTDAIEEKSDSIDREEGEDIEIIEEEEGNEAEEKDKEKEGLEDEELIDEEAFDDERENMEETSTEEDKEETEENNEEGVEDEKVEEDDTDEETEQTEGEEVEEEKVDEKEGEFGHEEKENQEQISDEEYQKLRVEIESELRAEFERTLENILAEQKEVIDLPEDFSLNDCTLLSNEELYCLSDNNKYRQFSENHTDIASYADENGIYQIVLQEDIGRLRILTENDADDIAPVHNKEGALAAWQRDLDDRWQIVIYDLDKDEEVFITDSLFNNTSPDLSSSAVVWQGWVNNGWEIFYADKNEGEWRVRQLTEDGFQNVNPRVFGENVVWSSYRSGEWHIISYSLKTGKKQTLGTGKKNIEPRFALIWEGLSDDGKESLMHLDLSTNQIAPLVEKEREEPKPSSVPNPFESGQTEAVQTPTGRFDNDEGDEGSDEEGDGTEETES